MASEKVKEEESVRERSSPYPTWPLDKCLDGARKLYEKDRFAAMPLEAVAQHLGYGGLNGASRPALGALRQFGLIAYKEGGKGTKATLTDLAKRILLPHNESEKNAAIVQAFDSCRIFGRVLAHYPDGHLPSNETLRSLLIREFGFTETAAKGFIGSIRTSLDYVASLRPPTEPPAEQNPESMGGSETCTEDLLSDKKAPPESLHRLSMPGTDYYLALPRDLDAKTARRMERWVKAVVLPALAFAATDGDEGE